MHCTSSEGDLSSYEVNFLLIHFVVSELCHGQNSKCKNLKRTMPPKIS